MPAQTVTMPAKTRIRKHQAETEAPSRGSAARAPDLRAKYLMDITAFGNCQEGVHCESRSSPRANETAVLQTYRT